MKRIQGQVLYVTLSSYLADNSRNIYYAHHYENDDQEISFLSFREYLETMRVPAGREITYSLFAGWLMRFPRQQRFPDAHPLYEEFRGVLTGSMIDRPWLSREDYSGLGIKQSIYLDEERELAYTLFEKYLAFLKENRYYDPNILAHEYLRLVTPTYDFVVVDEVQDITNIQLQLILQSLKRPGHFLLTGDSNQVVHPNFFSWSNIKSMFYLEESLEAQKITRVLQSNFRNAAAVTGMANTLLRIKQKRFGSIDRESNYLMRSVAEKVGEIVFLRDTEQVKTELNRKIRRSTKFAVLVMRDEDKATVRRFFDTPLLFSIQEAKGLEYENVILVNFITKEQAGFNEIIDGINPEDLTGDLEYKRGKDKKDRSFQAHKFFINSLYVAVTRAMEKLYLIESGVDHPLINMLGVREAQDPGAIEVKQSSLEEWQSEARKLEQQGRQEQADDIRRQILKTQTVPWDVCTADRVLHLLARASDPKEISQKPKKALFEYGLFHNDIPLLGQLSTCGYEPARQLFRLHYGNRFINLPLFTQQRSQFVTGCLQRYSGKFFKDVLREGG